MGSGSYWLYPTNLEIFNLPGFGSYPNQNVGLLANQIKQYGKPIPYSLHYSDRSFLTN